MARIEWSMWANEQGVASTFVCILGGLITLVGLFKRWQFGAYAIAAGIFIFIIEYPRGKKENGKFRQRIFQKPLTRFVNACKPVTSQYYVRFVLYFLMCIPCLFVLPTLLGGLCLLVTSILYLVAALKGEHWIPAGLDEKLEADDSEINDLPKRPLPLRAAEISDNSVGSEAHLPTAGPSNSYV